MSFLVFIALFSLCVFVLADQNKAPEKAPNLPEGWCKGGSPTRTTGECICMGDTICVGPECWASRGLQYYSGVACPTCKCVGLSEEHNNNDIDSKHGDGKHYNYKSYLDAAKELGLVFIVVIAIFLAVRKVKSTDIRIAAAQAAVEKAAAKKAADEAAAAKKKENEAADKAAADQKEKEAANKVAAAKKKEEEEKEAADKVAAAQEKKEKEAANKAAADKAAADKAAADKAAAQKKNEQSEKDAKEKASEEARLQKIADANKLPGAYDFLHGYHNPKDKTAAADKAAADQKQKEKEEEKEAVNKVAAAKKEKEKEAAGGAADGPSSQQQ